MPWNQTVNWIKQSKARVQDGFRKQVGPDLQHSVRPIMQDWITSRGLNGWQSALYDTGRLHNGMRNLRVEVAYTQGRWSIRYYIHMRYLLGGRSPRSDRRHLEPRNQLLPHWELENLAMRYVLQHLETSMSPKPGSRRGGSVFTRLGLTSLKTPYRK